MKETTIILRIKDKFKKQLQETAIKRKITLSTFIRKTLAAELKGSEKTKEEILNNKYKNHNTFFK